MIRVVKTLAIHIICILIFALFYASFSKHFIDDNDNNNKFKYFHSEPKFEYMIDFFLFSTTIQAGVGISEIVPISIYGKLLMIIQQMTMISIHVITIYIFS